MYRQAAAGKTRFGDTIVELPTRCSASTQVELWLLGASLDEYICMKKGEIAHYDQKKGQNCWRADSLQLTAVALWANENAMSTDSFVELV